MSFTYDVAKPTPQNVKKYNCKAAYKIEHSSEDNSVRSSNGFLLARKFRFGQNGEHSSEGAALCDPSMFAAPVGKLSLGVAGAAFMFVYHVLSGRTKRQEISCWQTELYRKRSVVPVC